MYHRKKLSVIMEKGMLQNISGGTLSGDFSPKNNIFSEKNTPKIHRNSYFATFFPPAAGRFSDILPIRRSVIPRSVFVSQEVPSCDTKKTFIMTTATIKVLLSHLIRTPLGIGCRFQNHPSGCSATPSYLLGMYYTILPLICQ